MAENIRTATATAEDVNDKTALVKVIVKGIEPSSRLLGGKSQPKNGKVDVKFSPLGLNVTASVNTSETVSTHWQFNVKKLPSQIDKDASSYKIKSSFIELTLVKKPAKSWVATLSSGSGGLEQAESDSSDEG